MDQSPKFVVAPCLNENYRCSLVCDVQRRDQAEVKRLERAKNKAEAVSKRHLDELAFIRRIQRQKLGVGQKQKLTAQEKDAKKLIDAKVQFVSSPWLDASSLSAISLATNQSSCILYREMSDMRASSKWNADNIYCMPLICCWNY